jgi:hypothetical protein
MTFDELCARWNVTPAELVWHLAAIRTRRLVEALLPAPPRPHAAQPARARIATGRSSPRLLKPAARLPAPPVAPRPSAP